jgi:hypothetical protein
MEGVTSLRSEPILRQVQFACCVLVGTCNDWGAMEANTEKKELVQHQFFQLAIESAAQDVDESLISPITTDLWQDTSPQKLAGHLALVAGTANICKPKRFCVDDPPCSDKTVAWFDRAGKLGSLHAYDDAASILVRRFGMHWASDELMVYCPDGRNQPPYPNPADAFKAREYFAILHGHAETRDIATEGLSHLAEFQDRVVKVKEKYEATKDNPRAQRKMLKTFFGKHGNVKFLYGGVPDESETTSALWMSYSWTMCLVLLTALYYYFRPQQRRGRRQGQQGQRQGRRRRRQEQQRQPQQEQQEQPQQHATQPPAQSEGDARSTLERWQTEPSWWLKFSDDEIDELTRRAPETHICQMSEEIMRHPAMLPETGNSYEHKLLHEWVVVQRRRTDPCTTERIRNGEIIEVKGLARKIRDWCETEVKKIATDRLRQEKEIQQQCQAQQPGYGDWKQRDRVHVFVDNSNIFTGLDELKGVLDISRLAAHLEGGRRVEERVVVGSSGKQEHWKKWKDAGYTVSRDERRGKEVFVDDALIAQLLGSAGKRFPSPGRVLVLATGDGNSNSGRVNFPDAVERALVNKWYVCVYTWKAKCNPVYKTMAHNQPGFCLKFIDDAPDLWDVEAD